MTVVVRFAPSPTGYLHVGNARVALVNWLFARQHEGRFILRFDDSDRIRSTGTYSLHIPKALHWLGLAHDESFYQSHRFPLYATALDRLKESGRAYPCYETREELERKRRRRRRVGKPPVYDREALSLSEREKRRFEDEGRTPHWRFRLEHRTVEWVDLVRGPVAIDAATLSDPILVREDGAPLYALASVVDDIGCGISHVIRGEDHVTNTVPQIQLFEALGSAAPEFGHLALLVGPRGESLSKRLGSLAIPALRERGIEPMAVNSLLARLGTSKPVEPRQSLAELIEGFAIEDFGRAPARFDVEELKALSARVLHAMPFALEAKKRKRGRMPTAKERLEKLGVAADEGFWLAVRPNLHRFDDAAHWWRVCHGEIEPMVENPELLEAAARLLPAEPWDESTFAVWAGRLTEATGRRGMALFRPLRLALTGARHGPELKSLLPLIGRRRAEARLRGKAA